MSDQGNSNTNRPSRQYMTAADLWRQAEKARYAVDLARRRGDREAFLEARRAFLLAQAAAYQARQGGGR